ncbi:UNKNOWN [Stylonychia lemnae]|uniref:Uncharacterized protein n=1 Tax=Stylonychia lemnae TaxID=5949 RepID=A0A078ASM9_STYLE|nr:UNKNOWN [Stylonychia lemnae]|eukprot:CDW84996.1 UNKNOWN [Stylonychia lemnae]
MGACTGKQGVVRPLSPNEEQELQVQQQQMFPKQLKTSKARQIFEDETIQVIAIDQKKPAPSQVKQFVQNEEYVVIPKMTDKIPTQMRIARISDEKKSSKKIYFARINNSDGALAGIFV